MGKTNWTKEQQSVIDTRKKNILVSASAGSGKTAVLVERIISLITDPDEDIDIDELLVVTFTRAAAAEMKERILNTLEEMLQEDPGNEKVSRQTVLIHSASISTIDSFCLDVIRNHFNEIDLDPSFRTGDEGEMKILRKTVMDEMLEEGYFSIVENGQTENIQTENGQTELFMDPEDFLFVVKTAETGKNDIKIGEYVNRIYDYSRSYDDPDGWLDLCEKVYEENEDENNEPEMLKNILKAVQERITELCKREQAVLSLCDRPGAPERYADFFEKELESLRDLHSRILSAGYAQTGKILSDFVFERMPSVGRSEAYDESIKNSIKAVRDAIKDEYQDILKNYFYDTPEKIFDDIRQSGRTVRGLIALVREFARRFEAVKRTKNIIDFSDMEQLAYRILISKEGGTIVPSPAAKEYIGKFKAVMIDEYQDSNFLQEAILSAVSGDSTGVPNRFIVGDVKQSIYGFRLSRPEIFKKKAVLYANSKNGVRIDLQQNFRSREIVLDSVNAVMKQIMTEEIGGINYDKSHSLKPGNDRAVNKDPYSEVLLVNTSGADMDPEETGRELEARMIAARIRMLMETEEVYDRKNKVMRPVEYRDIAILSRSDSGRFEIIQKALLNAGIPAFTESRAGYFDAIEIKCILDYLRVLDNPLQDIPLVSVLRSPMGGFSDEDLARLKILTGTKSLAAGILDLVSEGTDEPGEKQLIDRLEEFFEKINAHRRMISYTPLNELISAVVKDTGYDLYLAAMPEGRKRLANVDILIRKAEAFSKTSFKGVFNFINYLDQLRAEEIDFGEANVCDDGSNVVRIMTIHKSKGLEFPVVFLMNLSDRINSGKPDPLIISGRFGLAINAVYPEKRTRSDSVYRKFIQEQNRKEELGEELRIIYVAMTRAQDRLILSGQVKDKEKALDKWNNVMFNGDALIPAMITGASSYLEILMKAICRTDGYFRVNWIEPGDILASEIVREENRLLECDLADCIKTGEVYDIELHKKLEEAESFSYTKDHFDNEPVKLSVSDIKMKQIEEKGLMESTRSGFTDGNAGAARGTAYHRFLELWDYCTWARNRGVSIETGIEEYPDVDTEEVREALSDMAASGRIDADSAAMINIADMKKFFNSSLGKRMSASAVNGTLKREQMFMLGVDRTSKDPGVCPEEENRIGLVQGIIDAYFIENGKTIVVDYKTDRIGNINELAERYEVQLDIYGKALERLTGIETSERIMYSFCLEEYIVL